MQPAEPAGEVVRRGAVRVWVVAVAAAGAAVGEEVPPLPKWSPGDFERLEEGRLVPGAEFFVPDEDEGVEEAGEGAEGEVTGSPVGGSGPEGGPEGGGEPDPEALPLPLAGPPAPVEPEEEFPTVIAERYRGAYFAERPEVYTIDPQELLSRQEYQDRESFLMYHARESMVDLYLYLFDAKQELPEGVSIRGVYEQHFAGSGPTVLVFYFLGMPERSQILLSEEIRAVASEEEESRALRTSVRNALARSDPADQLDSFLVELSIRTYWFEKAMLAQGVAVAGGGGEEEPSVVLVEADEGWLRRLLAEPLRQRVIVVLLVGIAAGLGWIARLAAMQRAQHVFPDGECSRLLGAPHAAGVGAVMSFRSADLPPSRQREQMPDHLQRM